MFAYVVRSECLCDVPHFVSSMRATLVLRSARVEIQTGFARLVSCDIRVVVTAPGQHLARLRGDCARQTIARQPDNG